MLECPGNQATKENRVDDAPKIFYANAMSVAITPFDMLIDFQRLGLQNATIATAQPLGFSIGALRVS
jgi:hypothetical protein